MSITIMVPLCAIPVEPFSGEALTKAPKEDLCAIIKMESVRLPWLTGRYACIAGTKNAWTLA